VSCKKKKKVAAVCLFLRVSVVLLESADFSTTASQERPGPENQTMIGRFSGFRQPIALVGNLELDALSTVSMLLI